MTCTTSKTPRVRRSSAALLLAFALAWAGAARAADEKTAPAVASMREITDEVLAILNDHALDHPGRVAKIENVAIERFNFPLMTQLVLGKNRSALSAEQQDQFEKEFKDHLSLTYGRQIDRYTSNERITIGDGRPESNGDVTVRTRITGGSAGEGVQIDYRLRADPDGGWRIIDVIPEGVSLIQNFRAQVQDIVTQQGVAHLIDTLHQRNAERRAQQPPAAS